MSDVKTEVIAMIRGMPEETDIPDIMAELYFKQKVDRGLEELDEGKGIPHGEVKGAPGEMAELIWSPAATGDLEEICKYIEKDSEYYARACAQQIVALIETIPDFPEAGRIVPEYHREDLRERLFQNYRIVYRIKPDSIDIVGIVHGARLLPDIQP